MICIYYVQRSNVSRPHRLCPQCSFEAFYGLVAFLFLLLLQSQKSLPLWSKRKFAIGLEALPNYELPTQKHIIQSAFARSENK